MKVLTQRFTDYTGHTWTVTHIYSGNGHFEKDGKAQGWHIELGGENTPSDYTEVEDGSVHEVPESLPDIYVPEPEDDGEEATPEEIAEALEAIL